MTSIHPLITLEQSLNAIIVGKPKQIRLALVCLLAQGHLLLEDLPGSGKTTLAKALAILLGLDHHRVQFTADMLPSDITGAMIYRPTTQSFTLLRGPVFTNILLADEINRASPKCQSALLEAMEENQVSIEGETLTLGKPFFVIATQNPVEQYGTYPLPESQLDRFLFRLMLGYMDEAAELAVLSGDRRHELLPTLKPVLDHSMLLSYQKAVTTISTSEAIVRYIRILLQASRESESFIHGLSTRAGIVLLRAAQAFAFINQDGAVYPEHVQAVFPAIATHRLKPKGNIGIENSIPETQALLVQQLLEQVNIPI